MFARKKATQLSQVRPRASISSESSASSSDTPDAELVVDATKNGLKTRLGISGSGTDLDTDSGSDSEELSRSGDEGGSEHSDSVEDDDSNSTLGPDSNATAKGVNDSVGKRAAGSVSTKKRKRGDDEVEVDVDVEEDEDEGAVKLTREKGKAGVKMKVEDGEEVRKAEGREEEGEEVKILSHKEQRRLRKKQKTLAAAASTTHPSSNSTPTSKYPTISQKQDTSTKSTPLRRQNSVWVGNLSYRTTSESLRAFFESVGAKDVTRVHMPTKGVPGLENMKMKMKGVKTVKENRGFAYVDFSTPEAKKLAISLSEKNLDGRRLLIKDGDDFGGRPDPAPIDPTSSPIPQTDSKTDSQPNQSTAPPQSNPNPILKGPTTKTAQKILKAQKQPPCPCLFLGNLGFEATEERIREMVEGHARALVVGRMRRRKEKAEKAKAKEGEDEKGMEVDEDEKGMEVDEDEKEGDERMDVDVEVDVGIKKIRMGTFEDSGLCKGFAFVDFKSTLHSTAVLTNPANHFLDGRALVVEYASAEAARRGGYRPVTKAVRFNLPKKTRGDPASGRGKGEGEYERGGGGGGRRKKRSGEDKYNDWKKKLKKGNVIRNDNLNPNPDLEGRSQIRNRRSESHSNRDSNPKPKPDSDNYTKTNTTSAKEHQKGERRQRQTPGAALASAQRGEKTAIVPGEGTKLKFS